MFPVKPKLPTAECSPKNFIAQASVWVHLYGDFFDRYRICHFIEFNIACGQIASEPVSDEEDGSSERMKGVLENRAPCGEPARQKAMAQKKSTRTHTFQRYVERNSSTQKIFCQRQRIHSS